MGRWGCGRGRSSRRCPPCREGVEADPREPAPAPAQPSRPGGLPGAAAMRRARGGVGTRLFGEGADPIELEATRVLASPRATHVKFDVRS